MRAFVHDSWAALNHRDAMGDGTNRPPNVDLWVPDDEARRLAAYSLLAAYLDNCGRYHMPDVLWNRPLRTLVEDGRQIQVEAGRAPAEKFREYGDPRLLVEQAAALVLGETQELVVPDAAPLPDDADPEQQAAQQRAAEFGDWLTGWADDERLFLRLVEQEDDTVGLGDGVLVLGWDAEAGRTRLRKYDAESYFPVLSGDQDVDEFPNRVHFAWCERTADGNDLLHRLTYDRRPLPAETRLRYAYADEASPWAVYQTHAIWDLRYVDKGQGVFDLAESSARYLTSPTGEELRDWFIGVDFVPVVHVPNTPSGGRHFGRSLLLSVAQLLDDIGFADSDLAASSEVVGNTPVVLTGGAGPANGLDRRPGAEWHLGAGDAKLLDTSNVLTGQLGYVNHLLERLSVNSRLPAALLGRVKPNEVPSGFAMSLGFAAARSLIGRMRLVRAEKHPLILRFAMRFAQVNGVLPAGPTPRAEIRLGAFLPEDNQAAVDRVRVLLAGHAISTATAVRMLMDAGLPIEDAEEEAAAIRADRLDDAVKLLEATGSEAEVWKFLGLDGEPPAVVPVVPPTAGA